MFYSCYRVAWFNSMIAYGESYNALHGVLINMVSKLQVQKKPAC